MRGDVQDRQFTEKVALSIKTQIQFASVDSGESTSPPFLNDVQRPGSFAFTDNQAAFGNAHWRQLVDHAAQCRRRKSSEITELVKETLHGAIPPDHFDIAPQLRHLFYQLEKIATGDAQNVHRRATAYCRGAFPAFG